MKTLATCSAFLFAAILLATPALADAEVDSFWPPCGAPGDPVVVKGSGFDDDPTVTFGDEEADVIRSNAKCILCRVPDDADEGDATISVDDVDASDDFVVVAEDAPVVYRLSVEKGAAGQPVFVYGRRLKDTTVSFRDDSDSEQASVDLKGGRRAAYFEIPDDLDADTYTLVFENDDDLDTGDCSPEFEVVEAGDAELSSIAPEDALPGHKVVLKGTDLSPAGKCEVVWTDTAGDELTVMGWSDGYGKVYSVVPFKAEAGDTYDVAVELRGGDETDTVEYEVGSYDDPDLTKLDPDEGPAGSTFAIHGSDLLVLGEKPVVEMDDGTDSVEVKILFAHPGHGDKDDVIVVRVPVDLDADTYDVSVTLADATSDTLEFEVVEATLSVTSMKPDKQGSKGPPPPVFIKGTGFGAYDAKVKLAVLWDDGKTTYKGKVVMRSETLLMVIAPGTFLKPLPVGTYTVYVVLDPDGDDEEKAKAGTYTVTKKLFPSWGQK